MPATHALMPDGQRTVCGKQLREFDTETQTRIEARPSLAAVTCRSCWKVLGAHVQLYNQIVAIEKADGRDVRPSVFAGPRRRKETSGPKAEHWDFGHIEREPCPTPCPPQPPKPAAASKPSSAAAQASAPGSEPGPAISRRGLCPACGRSVPCNEQGRTFSHNRTMTGRPCMGGQAHAIG